MRGTLWFQSEFKWVIQYTYAQPIRFVKIKNDQIFIQQIQGKVKYQDILDKVDETIKINATINDVFKPSEGGYLDGGFFGLLYKGSNCHQMTTMKYIIHN